MTRGEADPPESFSTTRPKTTRRKPDSRQRWGRRRTLPGWVFLILIALGFYVVVSQSWNYNDQDVTIDAWSCRDAIPEAAAPSVSASDAGCSPDDVEGDFAIYYRSVPLAPGAGPDPLTVPDVDVDSRELNVQVHLASPASTVVLVEADSSGDGVAMSGDRAGVRWNAPFRLRDSTEFLLLVGPPPGAG